jgi:hypothetical protein
MTRLQAGQLGFDFQQGQGIFVFDTMSRLTLEPTQPPFKWALSLGVKWPGMKLTTYLHLMPRIRMHGLDFCSPVCLHGVVLN